MRNIPDVILNIPMRIKNSVNDFFQSFRNKDDIDTYKAVLRISWPAFIEFFLISLFGAVDLAMVGRLSPEAIAGVSLTNQPFMLLISLFAAINVGTTALVSWNVGAGNPQKASFIVKQSIIFNFVFGLVLSMIGLFAAEPIMRLGSANNSELVMRYAVGYFKILSYGVVFQAINMAITSGLRGCGQTFIPMVYNILANIVNVFLNYCLISGNLGFPNMGVNGAALATTISRAVGCIFALTVIIYFKVSKVRLDVFKSWKPDFKIIKELLNIGLPSAGEQFVIQSGLTIFMRMVSNLGDVTFAAHSIVMSVNGLAFAFSQGFSVSNTALVGRAVGADNFDLATHYTILARRLARIITGFLAVLFVIFAPVICMVYTDVPEVIKIATPLFYFLSLLQFIQSSQMSTAGALRGAGDTMYPLYSVILGIWVVRVLLCSIFIYIFKWGIYGAWLAFILDQILRGFIVKRRFNSGKWKEMKAKKEGKRLKY